MPLRRTDCALRSRISHSGMLAAVLVMMMGCSDDDTVSPPDVEDPRKTIATAMEELRAAYVARDIDRYAKLFDSNFVFVFDPADVQENQDLPPSWGGQTELDAARNLFQASLVDRIQVDFTVGTPVEPQPQDVGTREFPEGTRKVLATRVSLDVDTRDPAGGENIIYRCDGDQAVFFLYPDTLEVVDGVPVWKIFEWRDKRIGALPTIGTSWGLI